MMTMQFVTQNQLDNLVKRIEHLEKLAPPVTDKKKPEDPVTNKESGKKK